MDDERLSTETVWLMAGCGLAGFLIAAGAWAPRPWNGVASILLLLASVVLAITVWRD